MAEKSKKFTVGISYEKNRELTKKTFETEVKPLLEKNNADNTKKSKNNLDL